MNPPDIDDADAHEGLMSNDGLWAEVTAALAGELGLGGEIVRSPTGGAPVVAIGESHLVKWIADVNREEASSEAACLAAVDGRLDVETPRLEHRARRGTWEALVLTRVRGSSWHEVQTSLGAADRRRLAFATGGTLRQLHAIEPPPCPRAIDWKVFLRDRIGRAAADQAKRGLPPHLVEALPAFLEAQGVSALAGVKPCLLHADLHHHHVFVQDGAATGWIDFADGFVGGPIYDLLAPGAFLAPGDGEILASLLEGYGDPDLLGRSSSWWLAVTVLHRFAHLAHYAKIGGFEMGTLEDLAAAVWPR